jgi:hypothetical protein
MYEERRSDVGSVTVAFEAVVFSDPAKLSTIGKIQVQVIRQQLTRKGEKPARNEMKSKGMLQRRVGGGSKVMAAVSKS